MPLPPLAASAGDASCDVERSELDRPTVDDWGKWTERIDPIDSLDGRLMVRVIATAVPAGVFSSFTFTIGSTSALPFRLLSPLFHFFTLTFTKDELPSFSRFARCCRSSSASLSLKAASIAEPLISSSFRPAADKAFRRIRSACLFL